MEVRAWVYEFMGVCNLKNRRTGRGVGDRLRENFDLASLLGCRILDQERTSYLKC
jgi:hypothetical protein